MKKAIFFLILGFCVFSIKSIAQPTWQMPTLQKVDAGDNVCVPIRVLDFTDLQVIRFSVNWDPEVLSFLNISNMNVGVPGLDLGDFDTTMSDNGILTFEWEVNGGCTSNVSVTLPDNEIFFEVCFSAIGIYGDNSVVKISDDPVEMYVTRLNASCFDIGEFSDSTFINIDVLPLKLIGSSTNGNSGEIACVSLNVENWVEMVSVQFSINWDKDLLAFDGATALNLPAFVVGTQINTDNVDEGIITVSWFDPDQPTSLADGTTILQLCFEILGDCGDKVPILITEEPTIFEAVNFTSSNVHDGKDVGIFPIHGEVTVNCITPGAPEINIPDKCVNPGESFCVDITVGNNFQDLGIINFTLSWNPGIIEFDYITNVFEKNTCQPSFLNPDPVKINLVSQGFILVKYDNNFPGCDLNPGDILFTVCFKAVGPGGSNSTLAIVNDPCPILMDPIGGDTTNIGVNADNGLICINEIQGLTVIAETTEGNPGQTVCVDFTVQDFNEITRMDFTINWETDVLEFVEVTNFGLPDMEDFNFEQTVVGSGALGVEWLDFGGSGLTLADGAVIFSVCFEVVGDPEQCSDITFNGLPFPIQIENTSSNNTNIGLNGQPGQVCVLDPFTVKVNIADGTGIANSIVCMDFGVENFLQLTNMEFSINWNPNFLEYDHIEITGDLGSFNSGSYDDDILLTEDGKLVIDWETDNGILGETIPDGTVIFRLCFKILGISPDCGDVVIFNDPQIIRVTSATTGLANIGLEYDLGTVCVMPVHEADAVITPEDCPGDDSGAIDLIVDGGSGNFTFSWEGPNGFTATSEDLSGVSYGIYDVTVCEGLNPNICVEETFEITLNPNAPIADAGPDTAFTCGSFITDLDGSGSSTGPNIIYFWEVESGGPLILPGEETLMNPTIVGVGCFKLTVTNEDTGCSSSDVVCMDAPVIPGVAVEKDSLFITCDQDTVLIDASGSTFGPGFDVQWEAFDGGVLADPNENSLIQFVTDPGTYVLTISDIESGCSKSETVIVEADTLAPISEAGDMKMLGCEDNSVELSGEGSSVGTDYFYDWLAIIDGEICGPSNSQNITACAAGTYQLLVFDTSNGCFAIDTVSVLSDTLKPIANAGLNQILTCLDTLLTLDGSGSSVGNEFVYEWTTSDGNIVSGSTSLNPEVDQEGTYELKVINESNGCKSFSEVVISLNQKAPKAMVVNDLIEITCVHEIDTLDGTGSTASPDVVYEWVNGLGEVISTELIYPVSDEDTYTLIVTDTINGCSSQDSVTVIENNAIPTANAGPGMTLTCEEEELELQGQTDSDPAIIVQWSGPSGGFSCCANSLNPVVILPGVYTMTVQNNENGCVNSDTVEIFQNIDPPMVEAMAIGEMTCIDTCIDLTATIEDAGSDFTIEWKKVGGALVGITETVTVCEEGSYIILVKNNINGCDQSDFVSTPSNTTVPIAVANNDGSVTCDNPTSLIDAAGSDLTGTSILWETNDGIITPGMETEFSLEVPPGTYTLTITVDSTGCSATAETTVGEATDVPNADAGFDVPKDCGVDMVTIDGSNSDSGPTIEYQWWYGGGQIGNAINMVVSDTGAYTLIVIDTSNGCSSEDVTLVYPTNDGGQPAQASFDLEPCSDMAFLTGNQPPGTTGMWTILTGNGNIEEPNNAQTMVTDLPEGITTLVWTLTLGECVDYSSATVDIEVIITVPDARPDQVMIGKDEGNVVTLDVFSNDETGGMNVLFEIITHPPEGTAEISGPGEITYTAPDGFFGQAELVYAICNPDCPDLCDTTFVRFEFEKPDKPDKPEEPEITCDFPNGITPNNDGLNDEFFTVQDIESLFPGNQLIIFNRWGDMVFEAHPYANDWKGNNQQGKELPAGTYYYILRLDLSESKICNGDITIMR